jgi:co-chaperonin GroES (HSP10)
MLSKIKPGMVLVSITPKKEDPKEKIILGTATKKEMEKAKQMEGTHPVEKVLMVGGKMEMIDCIDVKVNDRVIVNPYASVIRVRNAKGEVCGLVDSYDIIAVVEG